LVHRAFDGVHDSRFLAVVVPNCGDDLNIGVSGQGIKIKAIFQVSPFAISDLWFNMHWGGVAMIHQPDIYRNGVR
jgi:hypothetical protein